MIFHIGDYVEKVRKNYRFSGTIVAEFLNMSTGKMHYVVETDEGVLHISVGKKLKMKDQEALNSSIFESLFMFIFFV